MLACVCQPTETSRLLFEPPTGRTVPGTVVPAAQLLTKTTASTSSGSNNNRQTIPIHSKINKVTTKIVTREIKYDDSSTSSSSTKSECSSTSSPVGGKKLYRSNKNTSSDTNKHNGKHHSDDSKNDVIEVRPNILTKVENTTSNIVTTTTQSEDISRTILTTTTSLQLSTDVVSNDIASTSKSSISSIPTTSTSTTSLPTSTCVKQDLPVNIVNIKKLPDGVQLTLSELRDMAYRQQHQIESQHQLLAAKEQRLRYLKEQEARHQRVASENERLRRLRDRVEAQELKLRKLRALRGQVDQNKQNNALLTSDLDSIRALFNEKEKELSVAVAKVDELTRQLEDLRRGRPSEPPSAAALELEKLRRELMYRNKLNEQQNARLNQQREALTQRQEEMTNIDKRISELQDRLHRKRILNQQLANQITAASNKSSQLPNQITNHGILNTQLINNNPHNVLKKQQSRGNIAAIEPYNHIPSSNTNTNDHHFNDKLLQKNYFIPVISNQLKNTNLNQNENINMYKNHKEEYHELLNNTKKNNTNQQYQQHLQQQLQQHQQQQQLQQQHQHEQSEHQQYINNKGGEFSNDYITEFSATKSDPKYQTLPYNTKFSVNFLQKNNRDNNIEQENKDKQQQTTIQQESTDNIQQQFNNNILKSPPSSSVNTPLSGGYQQQHMTVHSTPLSTINKGLAVPVNQNEQLTNQQQEKDYLKQFNEQQKLLQSSEPISQLHPQLISTSRGQPVGGPSSTTSTSASISTTISQSSANNHIQKSSNNVPSNTAPSLLHGPNKLSTIYQTSSTKIQPVQPQTIQSTNLQQQQVMGSTQSSSSITPSINSSTIPQPDFANYNNNDKSPKPILPPKPAIKPPPRQTQPSGSSSSSTELDVKNKEPPPPIPTSDIPQDNNSPTTPPIHTIIKPNYDNKPIKAKPLTIKKQPPGEQPKLRAIPKVNGVHVTINRRIEMPPAFLFPENESPPSDLINSQDRKQSNDISKSKSLDTVDRIQQPDEKKLQTTDLDDENKKNISNSDITSALDKMISMNINTDNVIRRVNKGNLKQTGKVNLSRRVSFDPLALLLDASLEGELELVKKTATQVPNPSAANDEGITALHNAICAGHLEIVQFLVEYGCDVNAQDSDGWTPLHCAASCNNVAMVRFLVEHGACIFATTLSDHETAAEKCEEDEEGFDGCSEYLYSVQEKLGILCGGAVYAVFDYTAQQPDELSFSAGDQLTIIRKGDENEREWWWARLGDQEGYIPRNLLGLYPRVTPKSTNE